MDKETLKALEEKLRKLHGELGANIRSINTELRKGVSPREGENLSERQEADIVEAEGKLSEKEIHMVEEALQRMADGTYGKCLECGVDIKEERLKIVPYAEFCIKCQSEHEKGK